MNVTLLQDFTTLEMNKTLNIMEHLYKSGKAMQIYKILFITANLSSHEAVLTFEFCIIALSW